MSMITTVEGLRSSAKRFPGGNDGGPHLRIKNRRISLFIMERGSEVEGRRAKFRLRIAEEGAKFRGQLLQCKKCHPAFNLFEIPTLCAIMSEKNLVRIGERNLTV